MLTFARVTIFTAFLRLMSHSKVARFVIQQFVHKKVAEELETQRFLHYPYVSLYVYIYMICILMYIHDIYIYYICICIYE